MRDFCPLCLENSSNLGGDLYRTACRLATASWRGELSRRQVPDGELLNHLEDETPSLEGRLDHEQLAKHVRSFMDHLPVQRDREVLERFYLREESRTAIRDSLQLTDMQFNQVLWRARQRFGEILRREGSSLGGAVPVREQAQSKPSQKDVFISYTHHDHRALEYLHARSDVLRERGDVRTWHDHEISTGTVWQNEAPHTSIVRECLYPSSARNSSARTIVMITKRLARPGLPKVASF